MYRLFHGWFSLLLMAIVFLIALYSISLVSNIAAFIYILVTSLSGLCVLYTFCAKCPCRKHACGHVLFGPISSLLPKRETGQYTSIEIAIVTIACAAIFLYPQFFLFKNLKLLVLFWASCGILVFEIVGFICKKCENEFCPVKVGKQIN